jgi:hypothetical protein
MSDEQFQTFEDFWPHYVREHAQPLTRRLHFVGTVSALGCVAGALLTRRFRYLPLALVAGYGPAWIAHFFVEGNRPATWQHPLWSLRGDFRMFALMCIGQMDAEVERAKAAAKPSTSTPNGAGRATKATTSPTDPGAN